MSMCCDIDSGESHIPTSSPPIKRTGRRGTPGWLSAQKHEGVSTERKSLTHAMTRVGCTRSSTLNQSGTARRREVRAAA